jgi:hypothetical protein
VSYKPDEQLDFLTIPPVRSSAGIFNLGDVADAVVVTEVHAPA